MIEFFIKNQPTSQQNKAIRHQTALKDPDEFNNNHNVIN